ncbi:hypothetical protein G6F60_014124 [Rhizopus arrhizus]|nr:hypothetical protein G6F60_014124 [Rhizopus arrhizus]
MCCAPASAAPPPPTGISKGARGGQRRTHHVLALREHAAMPFGQGEVRRPAVGRADLACHHVDSHAVAAGQIRIGHPCEQGVDLGRWQADQQQAVVDGI